MVGPLAPDSWFGRSAPCRPDYLTHKDPLLDGEARTCNKLPPRKSKQPRAAKPCNWPAPLIDCPPLAQMPCSQITDAHKSFLPASRTVALRRGGRKASGIGRNGYPAVASSSLVRPIPYGCSGCKRTRSAISFIVLHDCRELTYGRFFS
jgi:hypothetical protein